MTKASQSLSNWISKYITTPHQQGFGTYLFSVWLLC